MDLTLDLRLGLATTIPSAPPPEEGDVLLLENDDIVLLENDDNILLEAA